LFSGTITRAVAAEYQIKTRKEHQLSLLGPGVVMAAVDMAVEIINNLTPNICLSI